MTSPSGLRAIWLTGWLLVAAIGIFLSRFAVGRASLVWSNLGQPLLGAVFLVAYLWALGAIGWLALRLGSRAVRPDPLVLMLLGACGSILVIFSLGVVGLLRLVVFLPLTGVTIAAGFLLLPPWRAEWSWKRESPWTPLEIALAEALIFFVLLVALASLAPDTTWDSLAYHRATGKIYVAKGRLAYLPWIFQSNLPSNIDLFFINGRLLAGDALAVSLNTVLYVLAAAGTFRLARLFLPRAVSLLAALVFLLLPLNAIFANSSYVEIGWSAMATASLWCALEWRREPRGTWLTLSAIFAGFTAGSKTFGILTSAAVGTIILFSRDEGRRRPLATWKARLTYGGVWLATAGPCYVKSFVQTGTPLWPLSLGVFRVKYWNSEIQERMFAFVRHTNTVSSPLEFGRIANAVWSWRHDLEVALFLIMLLGAALRPRLLGKLWPLLLFALVHFGVWALEPTQTRFLLPGLPAVIVALMLMTRSGERPRSSRVSFAAFWICVLLLALRAWVGTVWKLDRVLPLVEGRRTKDSLMRGDPLYEAENLTNLVTDPDSKILLFQEVRGYYLDRDYIWGDPINQAVVYYPNLPDAATLKRRLRQLAITHVLVGNPVSADEVWYSARILGMMEELLHSARRVFTAFGYSLYDLRQPAKTLADLPVVTSSSTLSSGFPAPGVVDGSLENWGNGGGWSSLEPPTPQHPEFLVLDYSALRSIRRLTLFSHPDPAKRLTRFVFQYDNQGVWTDIQQTRIDDADEAVSWRFDFPAIRTGKLRLLITGSADGGSARVLEIWAD